MAGTIAAASKILAAANKETRNAERQAAKLSAQMEELQKKQAEMFGFSLNSKQKKTEISGINLSELASFLDKSKTGKISKAKKSKEIKETKDYKEMKVQLDHKGLLDHKVL